MAVRRKDGMEFRIDRPLADDKSQPRDERQAFDFERRQGEGRRDLRPFVAEERKGQVEACHGFTLGDRVPGAQPEDALRGPGTLRRCYERSR